MSSVRLSPAEPGFAAPVRVRLVYFIVNVDGESQSKRWVQVERESSQVPIVAGRGCRRGDEARWFLQDWSCDSKRVWNDSKLCVRDWNEQLHGGLLLHTTLRKVEEKLAEEKNSFKKACKLETTVKLIKIMHKVSSCNVRHRFACRVGGRRHLFVLATGWTGKRSYKKTSYTCSGCKMFVEFWLVHMCQKMISQPPAV